MHLLVFILTYPILCLLSRLPMKSLYVLSDILYLIVYKIFGYRKKVVFKNLNLAFPDKSEKERKKIAKHFYKHFTDLFVETIKSIAISEREILKRYSYKNPELVNSILASGKSIAFMSAHQANWEWSVNSPLVLDAKVSGAYTSLGNPYFDKIVKKSRERFGFVCHPSTKTVKAIHKNFKKGIQSIYLLISDQSPQLEHTQYWGNFFNIKIPFHIGATSLAKKFDLAVVFCETKKIKRGYYCTEFKLITDNPKKLDQYKITEDYILLTEEMIKKQPECYLWSHNRFKHANKYNEWQKLHQQKAKFKKA